jgi:formylglycine-generating enzyme required for sulfatase activity
MSQEHVLALPVGFELNHYSLETVLGQGGFGVVYKAHHLLLDELVVVKEFLPNELATRQGHSVVPQGTSKQVVYQDCLQRFLTEGRTLVKLRHPNVVRCRDLFTANGTAYLVMDFEDGLPLDSLVTSLEAQGGRYTELELLHFLIPLTEGLSYIHSQGVLHRDIKPANVFIRRKDGSPVIIDFGAAKQNFAKVSQSQVPYTEFYAPLEQIEGGGEAKATIDIHAFGALMYRLVTGQIGAKAESRAMALAFQKPDTLMPALELAKGRYREEFLSLIDKCLAFDANQRPQQMSEVLKCLNQLSETIIAGSCNTLSAGLIDKKGKVESSVRLEASDTGSSTILDNVVLLKANDHIIQTNEDQLNTETNPSQHATTVKKISVTAALLVTVIGGSYLGYYQIILHERQQLQDWLYAQSMNSIDGYQQYLKNYPSGEFEQQANELLSGLKRDAELVAAKNNISMKYVGNLIMIPAGVFVFGCSDGDSQCKEDEKHRKQTLAVNAFKMMETEATFAMWDACVADGGCTHIPSDNKWNRKDRPVINVSYNDIVEQFIPWINKVSGQIFRLPTEVEWEYAARAGALTPYSWGSSVICSQAQYGKGWFDDCINSFWGTIPVKSFVANSFNLFDMHGNVWELTKDCVEASTIGKEPTGATFCNNRILRGGSFWSDANEIRVSNRKLNDDAARELDIGFRLVQDL